jgi:hypothetical protein
MKKMIRTVKVKLDVPRERYDDLYQTNDHFLHYVNTTAAWAWRHPEEYCVTSKQKADTALYDRPVDPERADDRCDPAGLGASMSGIWRIERRWRRG